MSEKLLERVRELARLWGPSGREQRVHDALKAQIAPFVDEVRTDGFGNLLAVRKGREGGRRVLLSAHMDTPGAIALNVTDKGLIYLAPVGGLKVHHAVGQRVVWGSGALGVLQYEHVEEPKDLSFRKLFCDIGAATKEEALERVSLGDMCTLAGTVEAWGDLVVGPGLDNRLGCAVLLEVAERLGSGPHTVIFAFTAQGEVAPRGAAVAAFGAEPDVAVLVDSAVSGDQPGVRQVATRLGGGPALRLKDSGFMAHHGLAAQIAAAAEAGGIPLQRCVSPTGSEGWTVTPVGPGVPTAVIDIPVRYPGTGGEMADLRDARAAAELLLHFLGLPLNLA
ncbi:M42 family metallopeptidase [Symbiobacterium thermophilum]|uniref:Endo-1,4-beta-glucanase n=1 Tax=Symbiobacterium thermophilum (strain DSM 24528 / JCM 14929 / IAM 14863 / T) TaxID=292459 RepID=Q67QH7_SYMTH|nr:M42 family peptidase [Symbiobacterium thermophilum]BAD40066.1 endo-1,4-beta-glucanase [Symbiobacterium thermophilum IAM 14863]